MASKTFSEFTLSNNSQSVELVGLQAGVNIRTGAVYPAYKDAQGNLVVNKITSTTDETGLLVTSNIRYNGDDNLYFQNSQGTYSVLHTGNTDLLPDPIVDHGQLTGLSDNDHPQYALLSGGTFTGAVRANLDPVNDRDLVPFKYMKDELAKGAFRGVQWKYGGSTAAAPASGYMKIVTTTGQNRNILVNDVDANGYTRSGAAILAGDTLVVSTSPTAFARYMITAKAIDNGSYWTIPAVRTDTQGSQTPPPVDTVLTVTATLSGTDVVEEYIPISQKGAPDGVAPLDATGHIPADYLNISGFHFIGGWDAAPGILPPDGANGDMYLITNEGTLTVVPPQSSDGIAVPTLCMEGQELVYQVSKDVWYLLTANTAVSDTRYVQLAGSTMTGHLTVPAGASGSQVRQAGETDTLLAAKAPLASPAFTGLPTAPTAPAGTNTTQIATTGFVKDAITTATNEQGNVVGPTSSVNDYIPQWDGITGKLLKGGIPTSTFATPASVALKADKTYVDSQDALKANLASPTFTGNPTAPTQLSTDNSTKLATTEYVNSAVSAAGIDAGDINGPANSTTDYLPQWADASGKLLKGGIPTSTFATPASVALKADKTYVDSQDALKANLASPTFTGIPAAPTAAANTNTTQIATTAYVFAGLDTKASLASPAFTGTPTAPTAGAGTNSTQIANTAFVAAADALKANLNSPALTGVPTAPTATVGTNTTQIATTAFVLANQNASGGDVFGPANSTIDYIPQWADNTGKLLKNGVDVATLAKLIEVQNSSAVTLGLVNGGNTIVGSLTPAITSYVQGQTFRFSPANSNTGAVTLNINGLGAKPIVKHGSVALVQGDLTAGEIVQVTYDGTSFQLLASGFGNVVGPDSATADAIALFNGATGKVIKNGPLITTSATDTTAGRVLKVGDFGLGKPIDVTDANNATTPGEYALNSPYTNSPVADCPATIDVSVENGRITQTSNVWIAAFGVATGYVRTFNGTSWTTWDYYTKSGQSPYFLNVSNKVVNHGTISGNLDINPLDAGDQVVTLSGAINVSFNTFWLADNQSVVVNLQFFNTGNHTINWPAGIWWSKSKPVPTGTSQWTFNVRKNGSTVQINGYLVGDNMVAV